MDPDGTWPFNSQADAFLDEVYPGGASAFFREQKALQLQGSPALRWLGLWSCSIFVDQIEKACISTLPRTNLFDLALGSNCDTYAEYFAPESIVMMLEGIRSALPQNQNGTQAIDLQIWALHNRMIWARKLEAEAASRNMPMPNADFEVDVDLKGRFTEENMELFGGANKKCRPQLCGLPTYKGNPDLAGVGVLVAY